LDDVRIQRKTITFTKDYKRRTVFINKMINSGIMRMFIFLFIIIATSYIAGNNSDSRICVDMDNKLWTGISIPTHTRVCLEVNTHTKILDYFINDKHIKDRVVNVSKDVYFGV
jgi:hypothetical protein